MQPRIIPVFTRASRSPHEYVRFNESTDPTTRSARTRRNMLIGLGLAGTAAGVYVSNLEPVPYTGTHVSISCYMVMSLNGRSAAVQHHLAAI